MDPLSIVAGIFPSFIQGDLSDRTRVAKAQDAARRLLRIELRTNLAILDATLPKPGSQLGSEVAIAVVGHLTTVVSRACLGAIDIPNAVINRLNKATKKLIRQDLALPGWAKAANAGRLTLGDLLDFLVRKDVEMKALAAIQPVAGAGLKNPSWLTRLRNFHKVPLEVIHVLVPR